MRNSLANKVLQKVKASYSSIASDFDQTRRMPWKEFALFLPYLKKGMKVLDAGCGNGRLYEYLQKREMEYIGTDQCEELIGIAKKRYPEADLSAGGRLGRPDAAFQVGELQELAFPPESFDVVFCVAAFHHLPSKALRQETLKKINGMLKKDGVLILTVWNLKQKKYRWPRIKAALSYLVHFGLKYSWNDLWIGWGKQPIKRYYHAFSPKELKALFDPNEWSIRDFYFTREGNKVEWKKSYNLCLIASKSPASNSTT